MITIILAGGYAIRLGPLAQKTAKPLLKVGGKPVIDNILDKLKDFREVEKVVVATNTKFEGQFKNWLSRSQYQNVTIRTEASTSDKDKPGAIKSLAYLIEEFDSDSYLIIAGDNLFTSDLTGFLQSFREKKQPLIAVYDVKKVELAKEMSVLEMDADGRIIAFQEKPKQPKSTLIGTCIYLLPKRSLQRIYEFLREGENPDSPGYLIQWLSKKEPVYGCILDGGWWDIGTPKTYEEAINGFKDYEKEHRSAKQMA